jgi:hypothetical protein
MGLHQYSEEMPSIYPNRFSDELHISIDADDFGADEIAIYDMMGRKVFAQRCEMHQGQNDIVLQPNLKAGIYVIKMGCQVVKVVKQ